MNDGTRGKGDMAFLAGPIVIYFKLVCPQCGGTDFVQDMGYHICCNCGHASPIPNGQNYIENEVVM